jgi:hypothetical protein
MDRMPIRSYRRVFRIDRRVYRIDRHELPVPGGIPLVGLGYWAVATVATLLALTTPVLGNVIGFFGFLPTIVILPVAVAYVATRVAPDGRKTERFAVGFVTHWFRHKRHAGARQIPREGDAVKVEGKVRTLWDMDSPVMRRGRVTGPATVRFHTPVELGLNWRGKWNARPDGTVRVHDVPASETIEVRP